MIEELAFESFEEMYEEWARIGDETSLDGVESLLPDYEYVFSFLIDNKYDIYQDIESTNPYDSAVTIDIPAFETYVQTTELLTYRDILHARINVDEHTYDVLNQSHIESDAELKSDLKESESQIVDDVISSINQAASQSQELDRYITHNQSADGVTSSEDGFQYLDALHTTIRMHRYELEAIQYHTGKEPDIGDYVLFELPTTDRWPEPQMGDTYGLLGQVTDSFVNQFTGSYEYPFDVLVYDTALKDVPIYEAEFFDGPCALEPSMDDIYDIYTYNPGLDSSAER